MIKMPASSKAGGKCLGVPDTCNMPSPTGPVPTPYPNQAELTMAQGADTKVLLENKETVTQACKISSSTGDEAGANGGVVSGMICGEVAFKQASSKVFASGNKVVFATAASGHNGSNANQPAGLQVAPSQQKIMVSM